MEQGVLLDHLLMAQKHQTPIQQRCALMIRYQHLTADERHQIAVMMRFHYSQAETAKELSLLPNTISRELKRNVTRHDGW